MKAIILLSILTLSATAKEVTIDQAAYCAHRLHIINLAVTVKEITLKQAWGLAKCKVIITRYDAKLNREHDKRLNK